MDNKKFGAFIAAQRKEKGLTQKELADKLCVTDKAVSKWERGIGFPDIKLIEPLSEALSNVIDIAAYQRKIERRNILISVISVAAFIMAVFLIDAWKIMGFLMVCLPVIFFAVGVILLIISWERHKQKLAYSSTLILGVLAVLVYVYLRCKKNPYQNISLVIGLIGLGVCLLVICALFLAGFMGLGLVPA